MDALVKLLLEAERLVGPAHPMLLVMLRLRRRRPEDGAALAGLAQLLRR